jgi:hypothetical protein
MRNFLVLAIVLALSVWAFAQQPSSTSPTDPSASGAQTAPQTPSTGTAPAPGAQTPSTPGAGEQTPAAAGTVTEGCLGGAAPNFTITDNAGKVYKLSLPQGADASVLASHVGESVQVLGAVNSSTIEVSKVGKGTGTCAKGKTSEKPLSK